MWRFVVVVVLVVVAGGCAVVAGGCGVGLDFVDGSFRLGIGCREALDEVPQSVSSGSN